jgi:ABC-type lipoprotein release transport system permease subunit
MLSKVSHHTTKTMQIILVVVGEGLGVVVVVVVDVGGTGLHNKMISKYTRTSSTMRIRGGSRCWCSKVRNNVSFVARRQRRLKVDQQCANSQIELC